MKGTLFLRPEGWELVFEDETVDAGDYPLNATPEFKRSVSMELIGHPSERRVYNIVDERE